MSVAACHRPGGLELTGRLLGSAGLPAGAAVLDVGCGVGATVACAADEHGLRATGLDASGARVARAVEARPDLDFVAGRAEALPFADASFDAVLCECVLSTLPAPAAAVGEIARVLRPGGAALLSDVYVAEEEERVESAGDAAGVGATPSLGRRETVETLLSGEGLAVEWWSDESGALGRYIWDRAGERRARPAPGRRPAPPAGPRLGYFACLARLAAGHERSGG